MNLVRLAGAMLIVALVMAVLAPTSAVAAEPVFVAAKFPVDMTAISGPGTGTTSGGTHVHCEGDEYTGSKSLGLHTISGGTIIGIGCSTEAASRKCTVKSTGAGKAGEIVSHTLKGELGTVKGSEAATGVGLLVEPETTKVWYTFEANECTPETTVTGTLAGEISPTLKSQVTGKLIFAVTSGKQDIRKIGILGKVVEPALNAFGEVLAFETTESVKFESPIEVT